MASLFHRSKQRRAERAPMTAHGSLNLVPLVDILTSIVFFSLLTYTGAAMAALTAFDLVLPPVVITTPEQSRNLTERDVLNLMVGVRVYNDRVQFEHSEGLNQQIAGTDDAALDRLETLARQVIADFPQNKDATIVPNDDVNYERVIQVLERLKLAGFTGLSLSNRARQVAQASAAQGAAR